MPLMIIASISLLVALVAYFVVSAIGDWSGNFIIRQQIMARLSTFAGSAATIEDAEIVKSWQTPIVNWLKTKSGQKFSLLVNQARLNTTPLATATNLVLIMSITFIFATLIMSSIIPSLILSGGIYFVFIVWLRQKKLHYEQRFVEQLPQALSLMANALSSGSSLMQAIEHAVRESQPPIRDELLKVIEHLKVGMALDQALEQLYERLPVTELELLIAAILIQKRVGGNLAKLLTKTTEILREKIELKNELMVQTAQGRLSGKVVGLMPLVVIGFVALIDREFIAPLFTTSLGYVFLSFAVIAELVGFLLIRRILDIEF